jgi:type IV pilus assembly protein PilM
MAKGKFCLGLDIGSSAVKICLLKSTGKGMQLQAFDMEPLPPETIVDGALLNSTVVADAISELLNRNKIKQRQCALSVSGNTVIVRKITLPLMTQEELKESIQWEAEQYIPFDIKDVYIGYEVVAPRTGQGQMDVVLVAAKREMIDDYLSVCREARLEPSIVTVDAFSLQSMYEANYGFHEGETVVLLDVGNNVVTMNVVSDGVSMFTRDLSVGGSDITEEIQKQLNITFQEAELYKMGGDAAAQSDEVLPQEVEKIIGEKAEDIAAEIQRSLDFYAATAANPRISKIVVSGGTAAIPSLVRIIERTSGVPAELADPFVRLLYDDRQFPPSRLQKFKPVGGIAMGLSLRTIGDSHLNLLPVRDDLAKAEGRLHMMIMIAVLVLVAVIMAVFYYSVDLERSELDKKISQDQAAIEELKRSVQDAEQLNKQAELLSKQLDILKQLESQRSGPVRVLDELQSILSKPRNEEDRFAQINKNWNVDWEPQRLWLGTLIEKDGGFEIKGSAVNADDVAEFLQRLTSARHFQNIQLDFVEAKSSKENGAEVRYVEFRITGSLSYSGAIVAAPPVKK